MVRKDTTNTFLPSPLQKLRTADFFAPPPLHVVDLKKTSWDMDLDMDICQIWIWVLIQIEYGRYGIYIPYQMPNPPHLKITKG